MNESLFTLNLRVYEWLLGSGSRAGQEVAGRQELLSRLV
jgi:hypothetical protein